MALDSTFLLDPDFRIGRNLLRKLMTALRFSIMGADTLYHHYYDAHAYMYDIQKRAVVGVNYMLQRFYRTLYSAMKMKSCFTPATNSRGATTSLLTQKKT